MRNVRSCIVKQSKTKSTKPQFNLASPAFETKKEQKKKKITRIQSYIWGETVGLKQRIFQWFSNEADISHNGTKSINKFVCALLLISITLILSSFSCVVLPIHAFACYYNMLTNAAFKWHKLKFYFFTSFFRFKCTNKM